METALTMTRRSALRLLGMSGALLGAGAAGLLWLYRRIDPLAPRPALPEGPLALTPACEDGDAEPTESATQGPFYTSNTPERTVLREPGIVGTPLVLTGRVLTPDCRPIAGAVLDFWSCDGNGVYDTEGFKLRGRQRTDAKGAYRLETVKPSGYDDYGARRAPHIHVKAQGSGTGWLTTQLFFPGEPLNDQDLSVRESLIIDLERAKDGSLAGRFDFVLG